MLRDRGRGIGRAVPVPRLGDQRLSFWQRRDETLPHVQAARAILATRAGTSDAAIGTQSRAPRHIERRAWQEVKDQ